MTDSARIQAHYVAGWGGRSDYFCWRGHHGGEDPLLIYVTVPELGILGPWCSEVCCKDLGGITAELRDVEQGVGRDIGVPALMREIAAAAESAKKGGR